MIGAVTRQQQRQGLPVLPHSLGHTASNALERLAALRGDARADRSSRSMCNFRGQGNPPPSTMAVSTLSFETCKGFLLMVRNLSIHLLSLDWCSRPCLRLASLVFMECTASVGGRGWMRICVKLIGMALPDTLNCSDSVPAASCL